MSVNNSYPELPEISFKRTSVEMPDLVIFAKTLKGKYTISALAMAYAIFRNESANGKKGVNNNYAGIQADVGRWKNLPGNAVATCVKVDSGNVARRFLCFNADDGYKISFELIAIKATERYMITAQDYFKRWVGNSNQSEQAVASFQSMLNQGMKVFG